MGFGEPLVRVGIFSLPYLIMYVTQNVYYVYASTPSVPLRNKEIMKRKNESRELRKVGFKADV